jgi:hypothetical protein
MQNWRLFQDLISKGWLGEQMVSATVKPIGSKPRPPQRQICSVSLLLLVNPAALHQHTSIKIQQRL